jgi:hypothetical protein
MTAAGMSAMGRKQTLRRVSALGGKRELAQAAPCGYGVGMRRSSSDNQLPLHLVHPRRVRAMLSIRNEPCAVESHFSDCLASLSSGNAMPCQGSVSRSTVTQGAGVIY